MKAIKVLEDTVDTCKRMELHYTSELQRNAHTTSDQMEVDRLRHLQAENIEVKESCIEAIDILKTTK